MLLDIKNRMKNELTNAFLIQPINIQYLRGARVVVGCRDPVRGQAARQRIVDKTGSKTVSVIGLDLADIKKVSKYDFTLI